MMHFELPGQEELDKMGTNERFNVFRHYFAISRYNRLLIQQYLIRSAYDESVTSKLAEFEVIHNQDFFDIVKIVKAYGYFDEFVAAVKEEDQALQKIMEAYDKRMNQYFK